MLTTNHQGYIYMHLSNISITMSFFSNDENSLEISSKVENSDIMLRIICIYSAALSLPAKLHQTHTSVIPVFRAGRSFRL